MEIQGKTLPKTPQVEGARDLLMVRRMGCKVVGRLVLALCLWLTLLEVGRAQFTYTTSTNNQVTITGYTGTAFASVTIPATINGLPVVAISGSAFYDSTITGVTIPTSVTSVGSYAFANSLVSSVTIPSSVTSIGGEAFVSCPDLTSITVAAGNPSYSSAGGVLFDVSQATLIAYPTDLRGSYVVPSGVTTIEDDAFENCEGLKAVTLPSGVTNIGNDAFQSCQEMSSINIPSTVTSIGNGAFEFCNDLSSIVLPASVTSVGGFAFEASGLTSAVFLGAAPTTGSSAFNAEGNGFAIYYFNEATGFTEPAWNGSPSVDLDYTVANGQITITGYAGSANTVTVPSAINGLPVTAIGNNVFSGCTSLTGITIPGGVTSIGSNAFNACTGLASITLPGGVTSIGSNAFSGCTGMTSVVIPNSVTSIGSDAFNGDTSLTSITIPAGVTSIGNQALEGCTSLLNAYFLGAAPAVGSGVFDSAATAFVVIYFNNASGFTSPVWDNYEAIDFDYTVANNQITITGYTGSIAALNIPAAINGVPVTAIGSGAFDGCTSLVTVTIPSSITSIGDQAFLGCTNLTGVYFMGNAPSGDSTIFSGDGNATSYYLAGETGWSGTFGGQPAVLLPFNYSAAGNQITITGYTGSGGAVNIPSGINGLPVTAVAQYAFAGVTSMTSLTIPGTVTSLGLQSFQGCTGLTSVVIPSSITTLPQQAFALCSSLANVSLPNTLTSIGASAFAYCSRLSSITIPGSVTSIGGSAFNPCPDLVAAYFLGDAPAMTLPVFSGNTPGFTVYYFNNAPGYTLPTWNGYQDVDLNYSLAGGRATLTGYAGAVNALFIPAAINGCPVVGVASQAFISATNLAMVTLPSSITAVGDEAFYGCTNLAGAYFEGSAPSMGNAVFGSAAPGFLAYSYNNAPGFTVPAWDGYASANFDYTVSNGQVTISGYNGSSSAVILTGTITGLPVTAIGSSVFAGNTSLANLTIPGDVTSIGNNAFTGCTNLTTLNVPSSVTTMGTNAFNNCVSLRFITIPNGVTSIGSSEFNGCSELADVIVSSGLTSIGNNAFNNCPALQELRFLGNAPTLGTGVFTGDSNATAYRNSGATGWGSTIGGIPVVMFPYQFTISSGQVTLSGYTGTAGIIDVPDEVAGMPVTTIGAYTFFSYPFITSVTIPSTVTTIGNGAFDNCPGLTNVTIPSSVVTIGTGALAYCTSLKTIDVPASVSNIQGNAFLDCSDLTSVIFMGNAPLTGTQILAGTPSNCTVYFFDGATGFTTPTWNQRDCVDMGANSPVTPWLISNGIAYNANLQSTPNGDGVPLLMDYALNLNPAVNESAAMPAATISGQVLSLTFYAASAGVSYTPEMSTDLVNWTTAGVTVTGPDKTGNCTATVPMTGGELFMRIVVGD